MHRLSAGERVLRGATHAGVVTEHCSRVRLVRRAQALTGRGDVERLLSSGPPNA